MLALKERPELGPLALGDAAQVASFQTLWIAVEDLAGPAAGFLPVFFLKGDAGQAGVRGQRIGVALERLPVRFFGLIAIAVCQKLVAARHKLRWRLLGLKCRGGSEATEKERHEDTKTRRTSLCLGAFVAKKTGSQRSHRHGDPSKEEGHRLRHLSPLTGCRLTWSEQTYGPQPGSASKSGCSSSAHSSSGRTPTYGP